MVIEMLKDGLCRGDLEEKGDLSQNTAASCTGTCFTLPPSRPAAVSFDRRGEW